MTDGSGDARATTKRVDVAVVGLGAMAGPWATAAMRRASSGSPKPDACRGRAPAGLRLDAFGRRVGLAGITGDGPFSTVHHVDRTFAVLGGGSLVLGVGAGSPIRLDLDGEPVRFAGEAPCRCGLTGGPAAALDVITERGSLDCAVASLDPAHGLPRTAGAVIFPVCAQGEIGPRAADDRGRVRSRVDGRGSPGRRLVRPPRGPRPRAA